MARRLTIKASRKPAMTVERRAVQSSKLVYVICAPKPQKYPKGRSRILYIGTTERGVHRVASSMSHKALDFLEKWGVRRLDVFLVTCPPRPGVASWLRMERDLLLAFKHDLGTVPRANRMGKNFTPEDISGLFRWNRLRKVLQQYHS